MNPEIIDLLSSGQGDTTEELFYNYDHECPDTKFCVAPFSELMIKPNGEILTCVKTDLCLGHVNTHSYQDIINSAKLKEFQKRFINNNGKLPGSGVDDTEHPCFDCVSLEAHNMLSTRTDKFNRFQHRYLPIKQIHDFAKNDEFRLLSISLAFSNLCNFVCKQCSGNYSTSVNGVWNDKLTEYTGNARTKLSTQEIRDLNADDKKQKIVKFVEENIHTLKRITFCGGEVLMESAFYQLLDICKANNRHHDIDIYVSTNLSKLTHGRINLIDALRGFKNVEIYCSMDGAGLVGEYVRGGFSAETFKQNVQILQNEFPEFIIFPSITLQSLNALNVPDTVRYINEVFNENTNRVHRNLVKDRWLSIHALPLEIRKLGIQRIEDFVGSGEIESIISKFSPRVRHDIKQMVKAYYTFLSDDILDDEYCTKFKEFIKEMDAVTNMDIRNYIPEIGDIVYDVNK